MRCHYSQRYEEIFDIFEYMYFYFCANLVVELYIYNISDKLFFIEFIYNYVGWYWKIYKLLSYFFLL